MEDLPKNGKETDVPVNAGDGDDLDARREALRRRLNASQPKEVQPPRTDTAQSGIAQAWRLSSEFIAGVLVGTGIGWGIDTLFGTGPWGLIIFVLLGFGAAVVNVMRAAGQISPSKLNIDSAEARNVDEDSRH